MLSNTWQVLTGDIIGDGGDGVVGGSNINKAVFDAAVVGEARNVGFLEVGFVMPHHEFPGGLPDAAGQYCSVFIPGYEIRIEWIAWDFSRPRVRVTVWDLDLTEPPNPIITYSPRTLNINGAVNIQVTVQDTQIQLESSAIAAPPTHGVIQCNIPVGKTETLWGIGGSLLMECTFVEWYCCDDQDDCPEGTAHHCDLQDSDLCTP
jgi:hypothetical protein